jgi:hypothetical protein
MDEIVHIMDSLTKEISNTLKEMSRCKDLDQKKKYAEIVKLLSDSMSVFFDGVGMIEEYNMLDDLDDEDYPDDVVDIRSVKRSKKNKKNDIPF